MLLPLRHPPLPLPPPPLHLSENARLPTTLLPRTPTSSRSARARSSLLTSRTRAGSQARTPVDSQACSLYVRACRLPRLISLSPSYLEQTPGELRPSFGVKRRRSSSLTLRTHLECRLPAHHCVRCYHCCARLSINQPLATTLATRDSLSLPLSLPCSPHYPPLATSRCACVLSCSPLSLPAPSSSNCCHLSFLLHDATAAAALVIFVDPTNGSTTASPS